ncbi:hypothetical protein ACLE20_06910 [Rhizobium sp. YIM 134829]|uniref:hypothetical protein n=1 Tax=Rhizobium sp. YIM 134829 TaxID=3390453 RepID=UPI00397A1EBA
MMKRPAVRQGELQRIFRAAKAAGCTVTIDLQTSLVTVHPFIVREEHLIAQLSGQRLEGLAELEDDGLKQW